MTERVQNLLNQLKSKEYKKMRTDECLIDIEKYNDMKNIDKKADSFCDALNKEKPIFIKNDRIGFYRYQKHITQGPAFGNTIPNYEIYLHNGFEKIYNHLKDSKVNSSPKSKHFIAKATATIEAVFDYCDRCQKEATGELKDILTRIPRQKPESYHEALVMLKLIMYTIRFNGNTHITLGRFDQYMYPFYKMDVERGMSHDEFLELTEEFFISLNFDSDLYPGVQLGDNGQSMMLGGRNFDGSNCFNELSKICMEASMELNLIDPKINLRVDKNTPMSIYRLGTQMTKLGLGFPQYCNDDIVIPGLIKLGYTPEDAHNYSVAACWEFIVPDSYDVPNISTMNFPKVVNDAVFKYLKNSSDFNEFLNHVKDCICLESNNLIEMLNDAEFGGDAYYSLFFAPCVEKCLDFGENILKYKNFGFHGAGIANATDALAAIKKLIFEEKTVTVKDLIKALRANFEGYDQLRAKLIDCPKMGNNDNYADDISLEIMDAFCDSLKGKLNNVGGYIRPGTGSAQGYIYESKNIGATADGRYAYTPYSSSFSPAITTNLSGPLSVIQSFTKFDMTKIPNGGPLTMEIHDTTFRNDHGIEKVAQLVKIFIELGGQQLQLNAINSDKLLDAQKNPELYKNLIVRVWGWSGYFNELDIEFQNHIIKRTEFQF